MLTRARGDYPTITISRLSSSDAIITSASNSPSPASDGSSQSSCSSRGSTNGILGCTVAACSTASRVTRA